MGNFKLPLLTYSMRKVDKKGRVYLGKDFANLTLYLVPIFDGVLLIPNEKKQWKLRRERRSLSIMT